MIPLFFGCTIGFVIPIQEFKSISVIKQGLLYCLCMFGKIITGIFGRPLNKKEFLTVGFSMSSWDAFAFIIASTSYYDNTIINNKESFGSVIISPLILRLTLNMQKKLHKNEWMIKLLNSIIKIYNQFIMQLIQKYVDNGDIKI